MPGLFDPPVETKKRAEEPRRTGMPSSESGPRPGEHAGQPDRRRPHWTPVWTVLLLLVPCLALTYYYSQDILTGATSSDSLLPDASYAFVLLLVNLDLIGFVILTLLLSRSLIKAYFERRHRLVGSGFRTKLVAAFIGFSMIPTVLLAIVASGLVTKAMDVWFNEQIEQVLKDSQDVARMHHEGHVALAINNARAISLEIYREEWMKRDLRDLLAAGMARKRAEHNLASIEIYSPKLELLTKAVDPAVSASVVGLPIGQLVLQVLEGRQAMTSAQEAQSGRLIRAGVPIASNVKQGEMDGVVVVAAFVPESLLAKMEGISKQYTEYRQIKAMRKPIKVGAYLFVAVITVMILFGATWFGFYVARGITVPIQRLAEATEAIAHGNLDVQIKVKATDEIGDLVASFNRMTEDLRVGKSKIEEANVSLDRRRAYIEAVLATVAAGVLSIDRSGSITTVNPSAERILGVWGDRLQGRPVNEAFKELKLDLFQNAYDRIHADALDTLSLEGVMEVQGKPMTTVLNLSRMRNEAGKDLGFVLVFEDLTELMKAQKVATWKEVAQRIAHEIKNPLTPIQLSAQRLRKKFDEKAPDFNEVFEESTNVIISEVSSLKRMVDEFSKYARMPAPQMARQLLHDVVRDVVALYRGAHRDVEFLTELDEALPYLNFDREQLNRVFVNLFDNAVQAMEQRGRVWVTTRHDAKRRRAVVTVADDGPGIGPDDMDKLFLTYFTRKRTGTGLGLAIVQRIITDHEGQIRAGRNEPRGAVFTFELPV
ncbi:MAG: HAMP domain-containing protein [Nitrospiraceae bacterium]|nr:HAMP domain-containing protein [Nitrospiraceae bacterium]MSR24998.1 HAMP domain-containing protein [Nitrospiraceae bacterium]